MSQELHLTNLRKRADLPNALHGCSSDPCGSVVCQTARDRDTLLTRLQQAEQGRAQAVADYEAAELKLLHVRDLSEYLKKLAPGDKHYAGLIDRALDGETRG